MTVRDPKPPKPPAPPQGQRLLLVGEAEIARNTALGLSAEQALEAFRVEFGVDRCVVLPAISFHLDYDVSVRAVGDHLVALVDDPFAAAKIVLREGVKALERGGAVDRETAAAALAALEHDDDRGFLGRIGPVIYGLSDDGHFPLSLAEFFSVASAGRAVPADAPAKIGTASRPAQPALPQVDSDVGNLQRFLLAIDLLISRALPLDDPQLDRHAQSYLRSLQRREADRRALHEQLRSLGMTVVPVPSTSDETRSLNAINGLHLPGKYLMPAAGGSGGLGGLYAALDQAAAEAITRALGPEVKVMPIVCSESERRSGAVRCSIAVLPRITE